MVPLKRRRTTSPPATESSVEETVRYPQVVIFLLGRKMGASRRAFLTRLGRSKGFGVEESFSQSVTHLVSENNSGDEVRAWLNSQGADERSGVGDMMDTHLLDISWYTESMRVGSPVDIQTSHKLQERQRCGLEELTEFSVPGYACQRRTPLLSYNAKLTDALSVLADSAEFSEDEGRGVAFRRAAAVLKSLPQVVTGPKQLRGLPCLGEHSLRVIKEILEDGVSCEVETTRQSQHFKAMKVLTGIFGVGVKTADRWFREGICTLSELQRSGHALNRAQQAGVQHYDDLKQPVTRPEADVIGRIVERAVDALLPGTEITLIGGFRRGKQTGHDVDFLITHPEEGREEGLMPKIVSWLESQGFLLYQKTTRNTYLEGVVGPGRPPSTMDRFERCFSIFRLPSTTTQAADGTEPQEGVLLGSMTRPWRAVRVDLVVSPYSQFAFALLGWTGSKLFERDLRRWAGREKAMSLSSHALYHNTEKTYLRARSEEELFAHLGLEYIPPWDRNA